MIFDQIHSPEDVKALKPEQLEPLCREIREYLVSHVAQTGGHLASNLGVVELTVAIQRVFDTQRDRLVFDVGHQCYVHKLLTGRKEQFSTLRQFHGLSGFPKPSESVHDAFIAGHASNSVSVALGMARARTLHQQDYHVLALIGDGALTGGLAYEGLNNAGRSGEPLIVILNDNGMSINRNVGAMSEHLSRLRSRPAYYHLKKAYRGLFGRQPQKHWLYRFNHSVKTVMKKTLLPNSSLFEDMGFTYLGPIDGHDLERLCTVLQWAKELNGPVLIHVKTVKGKGYPFAERNPERFHGVGAFDQVTGLTKKAASADFSSVVGKTVVDCAAQSREICAITAAMESGTGLSGFAKAYPERFFDVGIAEGHAISMAAGLAAGGMVPFVALYSTFLQRAFDMLVHDVSLEGLHVVIGVDRAGLVGADGETHHGCFDVQFLTEIPGFTVYCPSNFAETRSMLRHALLECTGPVAVRYPRGGEGAFRDDTSGQSIVCLREGADVTLAAYGAMIHPVLAAAQLLHQHGIEAKVVKLNCVSRLQAEEILPVFRGTRRLLVAEDIFPDGCVGQRLAAVLAQHGAEPEQVILKNLGSSFVPEGTVEQLQQMLGLDAQGIAQTAEKAVKYEQ